MLTEPRWLFLLVAVIPIAWLSYRRYRRSLRGVLSISGGEEKQVRSLYLTRWFFGSLAFLLALISGVLALSGFRWGRSAPAERPQAVEVVLAFDVSRSMAAEDVTPSRLGRSVAIARELVGELAGTMCSVVVFKGSGLVSVPMTADTATINAYLDVLNVDMMTSPGTNLEAGVLTAISAFPRVRDTRECIVLFTDGGFLEGDPRAAARLVGEEGIDLAIVGAGDEDGVTIPTAGGVLQDPEGNPVRTALRADVLSLMAEVAEGEVFHIADSRLVETLVAYIGAKGRTAGGPLRERYRVFVTLGLIFLLIWGTIRTVRFRGFA